jgi:hypothetical protein
VTWKIIILSDHRKWSKSLQSICAWTSFYICINKNNGFTLTTCCFLFLGGLVIICNQNKYYELSFQYPKGLDI